MRRVRVLALVVFALLIGALAPALAQEEPELPDPLEPVPPEEMIFELDISDGSYVGTTGVGGAFWLSAEGAIIVWSGSSAGPMSFTVAGGNLTGTWSLSGNATTTGYIGGTGGGTTFFQSVTGKNTWSASGSVSGSNPYMLSGSGSGTSEASVGGVSSGELPYDFTVPNVALAGIMQVCGQVTGNWDYAIDLSFEGAPLTHQLRSYFVVLPADSADELEQRTTALMQQATQLAQNIPDDPFVAVVEMSSLVNDAERLLSDLEAANYPTDCPPDSETFMRMVTQVVADIANTFIERWLNEPTDINQIAGLQRLVEVAMRAGAMGSGAADPGVAAYLEAKAEQLLQRQYEDLVAAEGFSDPEWASLAVTAIALDYTFQTEGDGEGLSGNDICLVLGSC